jgi:hypothetical protein
MPKRRHRWFHRHTPARRQHADNHVSALSFSLRSLPRSTLSETESLEQPLHLGCCLLPVALLHVACCMLRCCMLPRSSSDVRGAALSAGYSAPTNQSKCSADCDITTCAQVFGNVNHKFAEGRGRVMILHSHNFILKWRKFQRHRQPRESIILSRPSHTALWRQAFSCPLPALPAKITLRFWVCCEVSAPLVSRIRWNDERQN